MKSNIKILIVEDDPTTAQTVMANLELLGYDGIHHCTSEQEVNELKDLKRFDIALLDIGLRGSDKDGIDIGNILNQRNPKLKLIFTTSYSDRNTLVRSEKVVHENFLIKPVSERQLFVAMERALGNPSKTATSSFDDRTFLKGKEKYYQRVLFDEIIFLESDKVGTLIHTSQGLQFTYNGLANLMEELNCSSIVRIHRSFAVHIDKVLKVSDAEIELENGQLVPIGPSFKAEVKGRFNRVKPRV